MVKKQIEINFDGDENTQEKSQIHKTSTEHHTHLYFFHTEKNILLPFVEGSIIYGNGLSKVAPDEPSKHSAIAFGINVKDKKTSISTINPKMKIFVNKNEIQPNSEIEVHDGDIIDFEQMRLLVTKNQSMAAVEAKKIIGERVLNQSLTGREFEIARTKKELENRHKEHERIVFFYKDLHGRVQNLQEKKQTLTQSRDKIVELTQLINTLTQDIKEMESQALMEKATKALEKAKQSEAELRQLEAKYNKLIKEFHETQELIRQQKEQREKEEKENAINNIEEETMKLEMQLQELKRKKKQLKS